jgi:hypothetical protein
VAYQRRKKGDRRKLKFYVNDHNPAIIARYILLVTLAAQAPQEGLLLVQFVELFFHVYADLFLSDDNRARVDAILKDLVNFPSRSQIVRHLTVSVQGQLWYQKDLGNLADRQTTCQQRDRIASEGEQKEAVEEMFS